MNSCLVIVLVLGANPADQPAATAFVTPTETYVDSFADTIDANQGTVVNVNYDGTCSGQDGNGCQSDDCNTCSSTTCELEKYHCWDSTYDMPQHIPYSPAFHGYYYYRPYNYRHVLNHRDQLLGDTSIAPYISMIFGKLYAEFPIESYNPNSGERTVDRLISPAPAKLPKLEDLLDGGSDG